MTDRPKPPLPCTPANALLLPHAHAWITNLWTPPFADEKLRRRLWSGGRRLDEFIQVVEREGEWRASCIADIGVTLARAAGWHAEALLRRVEGGEGFQLAQLAEDMAPDLVLVGARGLGGVRAVLGSVSDMVVHYKPETRTRRPASPPQHRIRGTSRRPGRPRLGPDRYPVPRSRSPRPSGSCRTGSCSSSASTTTPPSTGRPACRQCPAAGHSSRYGSRQATAHPHRPSPTASSPARAHHEAALLVVGSRGRSAMQEIVLGSVAMATLHHAHRPVLVVPGTDRR